MFSGSGDNPVLYFVIHANGGSVPMRAIEKTWTPCPPGTPMCLLDLWVTPKAGVTDRPNGATGKDCLRATPLLGRHRSRTMMGVSFRNDELKGEARR